MRLGLLAVLLAALVAALGGGTLAQETTAAAAKPSGLYGTVTRGPITPVCRVGVPCDEPAARMTIVFAGRMKSVRVRTDAGGRYRVRLAPGLYSVAKPDWGPGSIRPEHVRVRRGRFARVDIVIDTGIR